MKSYFKFSSRSVLLAAVLTIFVSCKDSWNEHYSYKTDSDHPVTKLAETIRNKEGFDKFYKALETTLICDKNGRPTNQTFLDLLSEDQFMTVWAPANSAVPDSLWAKYTASNKTNAQHKEVGEKFLKNHIARFKQLAGSGSKGKIYMLSGKAFATTATSMGGKDYHGDDKNIRCSNGVLHCLDGYLEFLPSLYEYLIDAPEYKDIFGDWFKSFTKEEIDVARSIASGIDDMGRTVYVDSVMIEFNDLMTEYGRIHTEDSTYAVVLPTREVWINEYNRIKEFYKYEESGLNNDSLQQYYTRTTMMTDMFFNMNPVVQRYLPDSVFSTQYYARENQRERLPFHIFAKPYNKANGIFGSCIDSIECSNGTVYITDKWPFIDTLTYLRTIKLEAENYSGLSQTFRPQQQTVTIAGRDTLDSPIQVMRLISGNKSWSAVYYLSNHLRGKYNLKIVVAPDVSMGFEKRMPNYIHPKITFTTNSETIVLSDSSVIQMVEYRPGRFREQSVPYYAKNDTSKLDTLDFGLVDLPLCNYDMNQSRLALTLTSGVNEENSTKYSSELWLDCIILEPVVE